MRTWLMTRLAPAVRAVGDVPEIAAIRTMLPWSFAGLVAGALVFLLLDTTGTLLARFYRAFIAGFGPMSLVLVVLVAVDLARRRNVPPILAAVAAAAAFAVSLPYRSADSLESLAHALGSSGLFLAIGIALAAVGAMRAARLVVPARFAPWLGGAVVVAIAAALALAGISVVAGLDRLLEPLGTLGDSLPALLIIVFVETALWLIGIHGPALVAAIVVPVYMNLLAQNGEALARGDVPTHIVTVSTFLFVFPGGSGATLPVPFLLARSRHKRLRAVALASMLPALLNANEPLMFGLPLVFNPILAVPYLVVPLLLATVTYLALAHGLVNLPTLYIPSSVPQPLGVFLATKDWRACVLVGANVALATLVWWPFVAVYERHERERLDLAA